MPEANGSSEFMDLSPFSEIDFPEVHRRAMEGTKEAAEAAKRQPSSDRVRIVGNISPGDPHQFAMRLDTELNEALIKAGAETRFELLNMLQTLPSLFNPDKYGNELMAKIERSRIDWEKIYQRIFEMPAFAG